MSYKISKELFEVVMGFKIVMPPIIEVDNTVIGYLVYGRQDTPEQVHQNHRRIPINDFFFMCKEWATKKCIWISSWNSNDTNHKSGLCEVGHCVKGKIGIFESHTEQQAVFDACQWILDNKDKK